MSFGGLTRVLARNHKLNKGHPFDGFRSARGMGNLCGLSDPLTSWGVFPAVFTKTAEPIKMPFGGLTQVGPKNHVLDGGQGRTNPFAGCRGDETVMRLFVKVL